MKNTNEFGVKDLLKLYSDTRSRGEYTPSEEDDEQVQLTPKYFDARSDEATNLLQEKMTEKEIVHLLNMLQSAVLSVMVTHGNGVGMVLALESGELTGFTHTLCLTFLGIAIDEELI